VIALLYQNLSAFQDNIKGSERQLRGVKSYVEISASKDQEYGLLPGQALGHNTTIVDKGKPGHPVHREDRQKCIRPWYYYTK